MTAMRILVAPDCFTGTMTAPEAAQAIAEGWQRADPHASIDLAPLSDGGPGFVEVLYESIGGTQLAVTAAGPLGEPTPAVVLLAPDGTAYVEAAQVCGTQLLTTSATTALAAGTGGMAELLRACLDADARGVVVGVGGTASTDGGEGMVRAMGGIGSWPADVPLVAATDVDSPLLGPQGAPAVFGPQKGAGPAQVAELEARLAAWAAETGGDPERPGAGAGGGLGFGLMLLGGRRVSGVQTVVEAVGLARRAEAADLLLTGEGRFDSSSLHGKVPRGVAWVAQRVGRPCVVLAGQVMVGRREFSAAGVDAAYSVEEVAGSREAAMAEPVARLSDLAARVARSWVPTSG